MWERLTITCTMQLQCIQWLKKTLHFKCGLIQWRQSHRAAAEPLSCLRKVSKAGTVAGFHASFLQLCPSVLPRWPPCCWQGAVGTGPANYAAICTLTLPLWLNVSPPHDTLMYAAQMGADDYTNSCHLVAWLLGSTEGRGSRYQTTDKDSVST